MALDRVRDAQFANDRGQAKRSSRTNLLFMLDNSAVFNFIKKRGRGKSGAELLATVLQLSKTPIPELTDPQLSMIAEIYDKFMAAFMELLERERRKKM